MQAIFSYPREHQKATWCFVAWCLFQLTICVFLKIKITLGHVQSIDLWQVFSILSSKAFTPTKSTTIPAELLFKFINVKKGERLNNSRGESDCTYSKDTSLPLRVLKRQCPNEIQILLIVKTST